MNCSEKQLWKFGFASLLPASRVYNLAGVEELREFLLLFFLISGLWCISKYYQSYLWHCVIVITTLFSLVWLFECQPPIIVCAFFFLLRLQRFFFHKKIILDIFCLDTLLFYALVPWGINFNRS
jgi:hypothetical protein